MLVEVLGSGEVGGLRSHGKMTLIDDRVAVIGSIALAPLNLDFRREVAILTRDPSSVSQLSGFFQTIAASRVAAAAVVNADDSEDDD